MSNWSTSAMPSSGKPADIVTMRQGVEAVEVAVSDHRRVRDEQHNRRV